MRKSLLPLLGFAVGLAWTGVVGAVGFGGISVTSALGQPLAAEIELVAVDPADKAGLVAHLASADAFKSAGIEYPVGLPRLKFQIATRANGDLYIKASSEQVLNEPFVSLLLELNWPSGRLLREYTFLLDPPGFVAEKPPAPTVQAIAPVVNEAPAPAVEPTELTVVPSAVTAEKTENVTNPEPIATPDSAPKKPVVTPHPVKFKAATEPASSGAITVKRGDTLSAIAKKNSQSEISLERMLVAFYRENSNAFDGKNMNRLRVGKILRVPDQAALAGLTQQQALQELHIQVADWGAYKQKLSAVPSAAHEQHSHQEVTGKIAPHVEEVAPVAKAPAKEVLRLSKGAAPSDQTLAVGKHTTAQQANAHEEEAVARAKELHENQQRSAALEKNIADMQHLVELKKQQAAQSAPVSAVAASESAVSVTSAVTATSAVNPVSAVAENKPKVKLTVPKPVVPAPSLMDTVRENPIYLGGGMAAALALAWGLIRLRRSRGEEEEITKQKANAPVARIAEPVAPSPETGDFTTLATATVLDTNYNEVDAIGEAELLLSFGRHAQAEEVLKEALQKEPANIPVKLKLLSIYAADKNTQSFQGLALDVKQTGDESAWAKVAAMGRECDPGNPLYGHAGAEELPQSTETVTEVAAPVVDFDLDFGSLEAEPMMPTIDLSTAIEPVVGEQTSIISAAELQAVQLEPMDFDITATHPGTHRPLEAEVPAEIPLMDFDVTATHPTLGNEATVEVAVMDFDLTDSHRVDDVAIQAQTENAADLSVMDLDLTLAELDSVKAPVAAEEPTLEMPQMPTDFSAMDFDLSEAQLPNAAANTTEVVLPEMDFDLTSSAPNVSVAKVEVPTPAVSAVKVESDLDDLIFDLSNAPVVSPALEPAAPAESAFTIDFPAEVAPVVSPAPMVRELGLTDISLDMEEAPAVSEAVSNTLKNEQWQEVTTKLDLAKAYQEMGDLDGVREILAEVLAEGDEAQRKLAEDIMQQLE